ncbi:MAG: hypothetical protein IPF70_16455 [Saprospiraceae bacterium]|nr:hypothetical protein [Saprospiraceae bacterium]
MAHHLSPISGHGPAINHKFISSKERFFAHRGQYELILEQTFLCIGSWSEKKVYRPYNELLPTGGLLAGVLFNRYFDQAGPPFGGELEEYQELFSSKFEIKKMELCNNSHPARAGSELFIECKKG